MKGIAPSSYQHLFYNKTSQTQKEIARIFQKFTLFLRERAQQVNQKNGPYRTALVRFSDFSDEPYCNVQDFLPFLCQFCGKTYCLEHRHYAHSCPIAKLLYQEDQKARQELSHAKSAPKRMCAQCGKKEGKIICSGCREYFCIDHRVKEDHKCSELERQHFYAAKKMADVKRKGGFKADEASTSGPQTLEELGKKKATAFSFSAKKKTDSKKKQCIMCEKAAIMACRVCKQNVCMGHRDVGHHSCKETKKEMKELAKALKQTKPVTEEDKEMFQALEFTGKAESASKALSRRMGVIKKCGGDPSIEPNDRFCLEIKSSEDKPHFPMYRFFSKFEVIGRVIDSIAKNAALKLDQGPRLLLYWNEQPLPMTTKLSAINSKFFKSGDTVHLLRDS